MEGLLAELSARVRMETPATDGVAMNRLMDVAEELRHADAAVTRIPASYGDGETLITRTSGDGQPVLVAGHDKVDDQRPCPRTRLRWKEIGVCGDCRR